MSVLLHGRAIGIPTNVLNLNTDFRKCNILSSTVSMTKGFFSRRCHIQSLLLTRWGTSSSQLRYQFNYKNKSYRHWSSGIINVFVTAFINCEYYSRHMHIYIPRSLPVLFGFHGPLSKCEIGYDATLTIQTISTDLYSSSTGTNQVTKTQVICLNRRVQRLIICLETMALRPPN